MGKLILRSSLVPRPHPAFCRLQYWSDRKLGGAWEQANLDLLFGSQEMNVLVQL